MLDEFYYSRSFGAHLLKGLLSPLSLVNPWFYEGLYDSTQDDTTVEYVVEHLFYISPWVAASTITVVSTGTVVSPIHAFTGGLSIMRYVAIDAGVGAFAPLVIPAAVAVGSGYVAHKIHTDPSWQKKAQQLGSGMDFSSHWA